MFIVLAPWSAWVGIVRGGSPGCVVYLETQEMRVCARGHDGRSEARPVTHRDIGAGQMGKSSSFAAFSTSLPEVQASVLLM